MTTEKDIFRSAKLLLDRHREGAEGYALTMMQRFMAQNDVKAAGTWFAIAEAIKRLGQVEPFNATVH